MWSNAIAFPETAKEECFPDSRKIVFARRKFYAESNDRIVLIPNPNMQPNDSPDPYVLGCDIVQCPVMHIPVQKYESLLDAFMAS